MKERHKKTGLLFILSRLRTGQKCCFQRLLKTFYRSNLDLLSREKLVLSMHMVYATVVAFSCSLLAIFNFRTVRETAPIDSPQYLGLCWLEKAKNFAAHEV